MVLKNKTIIINAYHKQNPHKISLCLCSFEKSRNITLKGQNDFSFLHKSEREYLISGVSDSRRESYVLGRYAAKKAIVKQLENIHSKDILIKNGIFRQPISENKDLNLDITISHCANYGIALAFDRELIIGVDIEKCDERRVESLEKIISLKEIKMFEHLETDMSGKLIIMWAVKESLSKCLKTGINVDLNVFEINKIETTDFQVRGDFSHFPQYKFLAFKHGEDVVAITFPKYLDFQFNVTDFIKLPFDQVSLVNIHGNYQM